MADEVPRASLGKAFPVQALRQGQQDLKQEGLDLQVLDSYQTLAVQQAMWDAIQDPRYVSNPAIKACWHNRSRAVDVTLVDQCGTPLASRHNDVDFSEADQVNAQGTESERSVNAQRVRKAIERRGVQSLATE